MLPAIGPGRRRSFQRRVLAWYAINGRDLPWRKTRDPYAILVSEVLSHQTQIARVLPVYARLLGRYPSVHAMAQAPLADVKAITDPLGYKIRGGWLHAAALRVAEGGGVFPATMEDLRGLPGVGRVYSRSGHELRPPSRRAGARHECGPAVATAFRRRGVGSSPYAPALGSGGQPHSERT